jgi:glutathione peroxidase
MSTVFSRNLRFVIVVAALICSALVYAKTTDSSPSEKPTMNAAATSTATSADAMPAAVSVHEFTMKDIDGKDVKLADYKGKVLLVVNVASKCGNTPQYEGLQRIYDKYKTQGLVVLGFPANNFMGQEPGTDAEIKTFCSTKYNVSFPMFSKISVKGADMHPLYQFLTSTKGMEGEVTWNFGKFLVGKDGKVVARFTPREQPESENVTKAIESALK